MVEVLIRSVQCTATAKGTGVQCRRMAIHGGNVCWKHGGASGHVRRKALERVTIAKALAVGDRRHPWEILADALHSADVLFADARVRLQNDETVTPQEITHFVETFERAARLAQVTLNSRAVEQMAKQARVDGEEIAHIVNRALTLAELPSDYEAAMRGALRIALDELRMEERGQLPTLEGTVVGPGE